LEYVLSEIDNTSWVKQEIVWHRESSLRTRFVVACKCFLCTSTENCKKYKNDRRGFSKTYF